MNNGIEKLSRNESYLNVSTEKYMIKYGCTEV